MRITRTIDIKATPELVWSWLGTPERAMKWQTSVTGGEILHETPNMIGTTYREIIEENGRMVEMRGVITDYKRNQLLTMHSSGEYNEVDVEWRLTEIGEHTRLIFQADIRFKSFIKILSFITRPVFKKKINRQLQGELATLKELCEQGT